MGYDLHITRAEFWAENSGLEISTDEWTAVVDSNAALTFGPGGGPYFAEIASKGDGHPAGLYWNDGNIIVRNANREFLPKILEIAAHLGASVQGDDGEWYKTVNDLPEQSVPEARSNHAATSKPRYLRREARWNWLMAALIALAVLAINLLDLW